MSELNDKQGQEAQEPVDANAAAEAEFARAFSEPAGEAGSESEAGAGGEEEEAGKGSEEQGEPAAGAAPQVEDDVETLRRKAQLHDANQGRLEQTQAQLRTAMKELEAARATGGVQPGAEVKPLAEVPEDIREDVDSFGKANPEYAALAVEDSKDGERLRRALAEYGPDHVLVAEMADRIADKRGRLDSTTAKVEQAAAEVLDAHFAVIDAAHPDYGALRKADLSVPENKAKLEAFKARMDTWAEAKPGKEYMEIQRIRESGTAQEVCAVLTRFKEETSSARQERTRQAAEAALAPPTKNSPVPVPPGSDKGSFEDGWNRAGKK